MIQDYNREVDGTSYDLFNEEERTSYINAASQAELGRDATPEEMETYNQDPTDYNFTNFRDDMYDTEEGRNWRNDKKRIDGVQRADDWIAEDHNEGETFQAGSAEDVTIFSPDDAALFTNGYYNMGDEYAIMWQNDDGEWTGGDLSQYPGGREMQVFDRGTSKDTLGQALQNWTGIDEIEYLDPTTTIVKAADGLDQKWFGDLTAAVGEAATLNMGASLSTDPERLSQGTRNSWEGIGINDYYKYSDQVQEAAVAVVGGLLTAPAGGWGGPAAYTAAKLAHSARDQYQYGNVDWGKVAISIGTAWASFGVGRYFSGLREGANAANNAGGAVGSATANSAYTMNTIGLAVGEGALRVAVGTASGLAQGGDFDEVLISSVASSISSQVMNYAGQHIPDTVSGELFRMQVTGASAYVITKLAGGDDDNAKLAALNASNASLLTAYGNDQLAKMNKKGVTISPNLVRRYTPKDFIISGGNTTERAGE